VDAVPDKVFTGTVKFISPYGAEEGNVVKFALTIELDPYEAELRGGLSATADISVYSAKNVLLVPVSMVKTTSAGSIVTVMNESTGQPEPREVTLGKGNFQYVEVLSGLKEGEKILAPSSSPTTNIGRSF
jgi:multidrug efflux pump subunit AcrA (membrane-fusion protein)